MLPWTSLVLSASFALVFGGTRYDLEDDQSSLHGRKTVRGIRRRRQVEYAIHAATESASNHMQNPEEQNQQLLYSKQHETSALYLDYDTSKHDIAPQYNNDYYRHNQPPRPPSPGESSNNNMENLKNQNQQFLYGKQDETSALYLEYDKHVTTPQYNNDYYRHHPPQPPPPPGDPSNNNMTNPENQNQQLLNIKQDETSALYLNYDKHDTTPQYNNDYYRHRPPPPPRPPSWYWDGYYGYDRRPPLPRPPPSYDGRYSRHPDDFGRPHRGPPPWYRDYRYGRPPPGRHWPPPPYYGRPPPFGRGPPSGHGPPFERGPPSGRGPPSERGPPGGRDPPSEQGPPGQQRASLKSTDQFNRRAQPDEFSYLQDGSSSSQSAENAQLIKNLKSIFGKPDDASNMNLPSVTNTGQNHRGGEALSALDVNTNYLMTTTPSPVPNLFQVIPVTPES